MDKAVAHLFSTKGSHYMYDANKNVILHLEKDIYDVIQESNFNIAQLNAISNVNNTIKNLIKMGFLSSNKVHEICHPENDIIQYNLSRKLWTVALQITQQCNLRCKYCVYSGNYNNRNHSNKKMSFETAKKSVDFLINNSIDNNKLIIGFYGGEPLLEYDLIRKIILYAENRAEGRDLVFTLTSNATLLNNEIIEFFSQHNVSLVVSLDGPEEIHDINRRFACNDKGSFIKVMENIANIKIEYPEYFSKISISAVIDPANDFSCASSFFSDSSTINELLTNVAIINDEYRTEKITYSNGFDLSIKYEYFKLFLSKLGRLDEKYTSKLVRNHYYETKRSYENLKPTEGFSKRMHPSGPCVPGITRLFINADGFMYPCERVSEKSEVMKIGHIDFGFDIENVRKLLNIGCLTDNYCKACWAFRFCSLCARSADCLTELSAEKRISNCQKVRTTVENNLKDICMLKEKGMDFEDDIILIS